MSNGPGPTGGRHAAAVARSAPLRRVALLSYRAVLWLTYGIVFAVIVAGVLLVAFLPHVTPVQQYGPNVVADFFGLFITVTLVERLLQWQQTRRDAPLRTVVLERVKAQINGLLNMLVFYYKAAATEGSPAHTAIDALLTAWQAQAHNLDYRKSAGGPAGNRPWADFIAETLSRFETGLYEVIDRYPLVLGADFPAAFERVRSASTFHLMSWARGIARVDPKAGANPLGISEVGRPDRDREAEFTNLLSDMIRAYLAIGGSPLTVSSRLYMGDLGIAWGSGRFDE